jgi:hypothetical protein
MAASVVMGMALAAGFMGGMYGFYSCSNLEISSLRKCYKVEKRSGQARHSVVTAGVYMEVHEHRIAEIVIFAALEISKGE